MKSQELQLVSLGACDFILVSVEQLYLNRNALFVFALYGAYKYPLTQVSQCYRIIQFENLFPVLDLHFKISFLNQSCSLFARTFPQNFSQRATVIVSTDAQLQTVLKLLMCRAKQATKKSSMIPWQPNGLYTVNRTHFFLVLEVTGKTHIFKCLSKKPPIILQLNGKEKVQVPLKYLLHQQFCFCFLCYWSD